MRLPLTRAAVLAGLLMISVVAGAATRYVSDELSINMRLGPGTGYRISQLLDAGEPLETLSAKDGWTRIRTAGGAMGYVLSRFLSDEQPARTRIEAMQKQTAELKAGLAEAQSGSRKFDQTKQELLSKNKKLSIELQRIRQTSANAIRIGNENEKFREQLLSMRSENERLRHENAALKSRREGMKVGALILVGGIVIGLLLPLFRRRRKGSWDSL